MFKYHTYQIMMEKGTYLGLDDSKELAIKTSGIHLK